MARAKANSHSEKAVTKQVLRKAPAKSEKSAVKKANPRTASKRKPAAARALSMEVLLPETLDSSSATVIRDQLLACRGAPLVVDAGQVRRTGMQAVQILIAAARTWQAEGQSYVVTNPTSEFLDTLALVGLSRKHLLVEEISR
jgi:chemotaxis protein CheX